MQWDKEIRQKNMKAYIAKFDSIIHKESSKIALWFNNNYENFK